LQGTWGSRVSSWQTRITCLMHRHTMQTCVVLAWWCIPTHPVNDNAVRGDGGACWQAEVRCSQVPNPRSSVHDAPHAVAAPGTFVSVAFFRAHATWDPTSVSCRRRGGAILDELALVTRAATAAVVASVTCCAGPDPHVVGRGTEGNTVERVCEDPNLACSEHVLAEDRERQRFSATHPAFRTVLQASCKAPSMTCSGMQAHC
jgi:hypothetical protein